MIPTSKEMELPILEFLKNGEDARTKDINDYIAKVLNIADEERKIPQGNGNTFIFANRAGWGMTELKRKGEIAKQGYGVWKITQKGLDRLKDTDPSKQALQQPYIEEEYPTDIIKKAYESHRQKIKDQLLDNILDNDEWWFENLVKELLLKMGYGEFGLVTQKSNDRGVDVIISEDPLGLGSIYAQAKRLDKNGTVGEPLVNQFWGAIDKKGRGVFVTTGRFSKHAYDAKKDRPIVFIDGNELTDLLIKYKMGVKEIESYPVLSIDEKFFISEEI